MSMLKQRTIFMGERVPASIVLDDGRLEVRRINVELLQDSDSEGDGEESVQVNGTRKRRRLTNLSPEEKMLRRKLKNRMAAQTARDRKKQKMAELEEALALMEAENRKLQEENQSLKRSTCSLSRENEILKTRLQAPLEILSPENDQQCTRIDAQFETPSVIVKMENSIELEEEVVVASSPPPATAQTVTTETWSVSNDESAELVPQQKDCSMRTIFSLVTAVYLQRVMLAISLVHMCLTGSVTVAGSPSSLWETMNQKSSSLVAHPPPINPSLPQWWGSHQKSWNPSKNS